MKGAEACSLAEARGAAVAVGVRPGVQVLRDTAPLHIQVQDEGGVIVTSLAGVAILVGAEELHLEADALYTAVDDRVARVREHVLQLVAGGIEGDVMGVGKLEVPAGVTDLLALLGELEEEGGRIVEGVVRLDHQTEGGVQVVSRITVVHLDLITFCAGDEGERKEKSRESQHRRVLLVAPDWA